MDTGAALVGITEANTKGDCVQTRGGGMCIPADRLSGLCESLPEKMTPCPGAETGKRANPRTKPSSPFF